MAQDTITEICGEVTPGVSIEINEDQAELVWVESLRFHLEHHADLMAPWTDDDGFITDAGREAFVRLLGHGAEAADYEEWDDEPSIGVIFPLKGVDTDDEDALHSAAWPIVAFMHNVTDPGTFGAPYVMRYLGQTEPLTD